ncbi:MAG: glycosyltransferase family 39 protein [Sphingobium sp.]
MTRTVVRDCSPAKDEDGLAALLPALTVAALVMGAAHRLLSGFDAPLWFDETYSAEIASQHELRALLLWCLNDVAGPIYYVLLFLWEKIAGNGDLALRLPSLLFAFAAPLLILWKGHPDRRVRMIWAAAVALSPVCARYASEARPYALLTLLACGQAVAYLRLLQRPGRPAALTWTAISASMVLTHYHAALICGIQGLLYLAIHRRRAVETWPALVGLIPLLIWIPLHLPTLSAFSQPDVVWYSTLTPDALWLVPALLAGLAVPGLALLAAMGCTLARDLIRTARRQAPWPYTVEETALAGSGALAFALLLGAGFLWPCFVPRYALSFIPAILGGVAFWANRTMRDLPIAGPATIILMMAASANQIAAQWTSPRADYRYAYNLEEASAWIGDQGARRLVYLWDSPVAAVADPIGNALDWRATQSGRTAAIGSFFLRRDGRDIPTVAVDLPPIDEDPNLALLRAAGNAPNTALLWSYDVTIPRTRGAIYPWRIAQIDRRWTCRDFGSGPVTILACIRR